MRVTVKRNERESGIRRLWNGQRGAEVRVDGERVGSIGFCESFGTRKRGFYFAVSSTKYGIKGKNTCDEAVDDYETAKAAAIEYVKAELRKSKSDG